MSSSENSDQTTSIIAKNAMEELRVGISEYRGHHLVNCRIWANYDSPLEERRPTRKGFALRLEQLPELIAALQKAEEEARAAGLLKDAEEAA